MGAVFHLVCHECSEEGVYEKRSTAVSALERHERDADHRMTLLDIEAARAESPDVEPSV